MVVAISSMVSSMTEILSSISCTLWWSLPSVVPVQIPKKNSFPGFPQLLFSLLLLCCFSGLEQFYLFPSVVFVFFLCALSLSPSLKRLIHFLQLFSSISIRDLFISPLRIFVMSIKLVLRSLSCASAMLAYSGPAVVGYLDSDIALAVIVLCVCWHLGIWVWGAYKSRCWFMGLPWLYDSFFAWFLYLL